MLAKIVFSKPFPKVVVNFDIFVLKLHDVSVTISTVILYYYELRYK